MFSAVDQDPAWRRRGRPPGCYRSTAWIPGNFLSEGTMFIDVGLTTLGPPILQFFERQAVAFQVIDSPEGDSARGDWAGGVWRCSETALEMEHRVQPGRASNHRSEC